MKYFSSLLLLLFPLSTLRRRFCIFTQYLTWRSFRLLLFQTGSEGPSDCQAAKSKDSTRAGPMVLDLVGRGGHV